MIRRIDWNAEQERARGMTAEAIHGALVDIWRSLPSADARDRALGTDDGGFYRDVASVLHAERAARGAGPARGGGAAMTRALFENDPAAAPAAWVLVGPLRSIGAPFALGAVVGRCERGHRLRAMAHEAICLDCGDRYGRQPELFTMKREESTR